MITFLDLIRKYFDHLDYIILLLNKVLLISLIYNFNYIMDNINDYKLVLFITYIYFLISIYLLYNKFKNVYIEYNEIKKLRNELQNPYIMININDHLIFDNFLIENNNSEKIYKSLNSLFYSVIGEYENSYVLNDQQKNLLKNIIKNDLYTNGSLHETLKYFIEYFYYQNIIDYNINIPDIEHNNNVVYILKEYDKLMNVNN